MTASSPSRTAAHSHAAAAQSHTTTHRHAAAQRHAVATRSHAASAQRHAVTTRRALPAVLALGVSLVLAACGASTGTPTVPPDATSTLAPAATATAVPATPGPTPTAAPVFPATLTDDEGTAVAIASAPARIVSLTPATTEILFAIGAGDRVIAKVEDVADFPPAAHDLPVVATYAGVDVEKIVSLGADLVLSGGSGLSQGPAVEQLRRAGIPVLVLYPQTLAGAIDGIRLVGRAVGSPGAADGLASWMEGQLQVIGSLVAGLEKPRTFYEIDYGQAIYTPPADSIYGEMLRLAGAEPISGDASYAISLETLVAADPQLILLGDAAYGVTADSVRTRPGWGGMAAVASGRILPIDDIVITRAGPRLVDGLRALVAAIHPDVALPAPTASPAP